MNHLPLTLKVESMDLPLSLPSMLLDDLGGVGEFDIPYVTLSSSSLHVSRSLSTCAISHAGAEELGRGGRDDIGEGSERGRGARRSSEREIRAG